MLITIVFHIFDFKNVFFKDKIPKIDFSSPAVEGEEGSADGEQFHPERSPRPDQEAGRR